MTTTTLDLPTSYTDASTRARYLRSPSQITQVHIGMINDHLEQYADNRCVLTLESAVAITAKTLALTNSRTLTNQLVYIIQDVTRTMEWHLART